MLLIETFSPGTSTATLGPAATLTAVAAEDETVDAAVLVASFLEWRSGWSGASAGRRRARALRRVRSLPRTRQGLGWLLLRQKNREEWFSHSPSARRPVKKHGGGDLKIHQESVGTSQFPFAARFQTAKHAPRGFEERVLGNPASFTPPPLCPPGMDLPRQKRNTAQENTAGPLWVLLKSWFEARLLPYLKSLQAGEFMSLLVRAGQNHFLC